MPPFIPTPREIFLLALLLVGLLTFSATVQPSNLSVPDLAKLGASLYPFEDDTPPPPSTFESQFSLQALHAPVSWGSGQVPQTQIVAHVPGMCGSLVYYTLFVNSAINASRRVDNIR